MAILVDTGILYALADAGDAWHERARGFLEKNREPLLVPVTVLPEVCYLMNEYLGSTVERAFVGSLVRRELHIEALAAADVLRAAELLDEYADADIGFVDATLVAMAERTKCRRVLTTDRRHFSAIRPRHTKALDLLP